MNPLVLQVQDVENHDEWTYVFEESPVVFGRGDGAQFRVVRAFVSEIHGSFSYDESQRCWKYVDLDSASGTATDAGTLEPEQAFTVTPGTTLYVGTLALTRLAEAPQERPALNEESPFSRLPRAQRTELKQTAPIAAIAAKLSARRSASATANMPPTPVPADAGYSVNSAPSSGEGTKPSPIAPPDIGVGIGPGNSRAAWADDPPSLSCGEPSPGDRPSVTAGGTQYLPNSDTLGAGETMLLDEATPAMPSIEGVRPIRRPPPSRHAPPARPALPRRRARAGVALVVAVAAAIALVVGAWALRRPRTTTPTSQTDPEDAEMFPRRIPSHSPSAPAVVSAPAAPTTPTAPAPARPSSRREHPRGYNPTPQSSRTKTGHNSAPILEAE
jgi:hypothetical protein